MVDNSQDQNLPPFGQYVDRWVEVVVDSNIYHGRLVSSNVAGRWFVLSPYLQSSYAGNNVPHCLFIAQDKRTVRYGDHSIVSVSPYAYRDLKALIALRERELAPILHELEESLRHFEERRKGGFSPSP